VLRIKVDADKDFMRQTGQLLPEKIAHCAGAREAIPALQVLRHRPRSKLSGSLYLHHGIGCIGACTFRAEQVPVFMGH